MRVLLWMASSGEVPGGHVVQWRRTAAALARKGIDVVVSDDPACDVSGFDVAHAFFPSPAQVRRARSAGAVVAISTIYFDRRYRKEPQARRYSWPTLSSRVRVGGGALARSLAGPERVAAAARVIGDFELAASYESADVLLPNSEAEAATIRAQLAVTTPCCVVPNAVDECFLQAAPPDRDSRTYVVCLGRLEPHKNQLSVIRALSGTGLPLRVVGPPHPHHPDYYRACVRAAGSNTTVEAAVDYGSPEHLTLMAGARVSVLASWFETTGLASLEAAAAGAAVVSTSRGFSREYLGDLAEFCQPESVGSIRGAVQRAWDRDESSVQALRRRVGSSFTWDRAADATIAAYESQLDARRRVLR